MNDILIWAFVIGMVWLYSWASDVEKKYKSNG